MQKKRVLCPMAHKIIGWTTMIWFLISLPVDAVDTPPHSPLKWYTTPFMDSIPYIEPTDVVMSNMNQSQNTAITNIFSTSPTKGKMSLEFDWSCGPYPITEQAQDVPVLSDDDVCHPGALCQNNIDNKAFLEPEDEDFFNVNAPSQSNIITIPYNPTCDSESEHTPVRKRDIKKQRKHQSRESSLGIPFPIPNNTTHNQSPLGNTDDIKQKKPSLKKKILQYCCAQSIEAFNITHSHSMENSNEKYEDSPSIKTVVQCHNEQCHRIIDDLLGWGLQSFIKTIQKGGVLANGHSIEPWHQYHTIKNILDHPGAGKKPKQYFEKETLRLFLTELWELRSKKPFKVFLCKIFEDLNQQYPEKLFATRHQDSDLQWSADMLKHLLKKTEFYLAIYKNLSQIHYNQWRHHKMLLKQDKNNFPKHEKFYRCDIKNMKLLAHTFENKSEKMEKMLKFLLEKFNITIPIQDKISLKYCYQWRTLKSKAPHKKIIWTIIHTSPIQQNAIKCAIANIRTHYPLLQSTPAAKTRKKNTIKRKINLTFR